VHSNQGFSLPRSLDPKRRASTDWTERATKTDDYEQAAGEGLAPLRVPLAGQDAATLQPLSSATTDGGNRVNVLLVADDGDRCSKPQGRRLTMDRTLLTASGIRWVVGRPFFPGR
jgi:hypothetical protein